MGSEAVVRRELTNSLVKLGLARQRLEELEARIPESASSYRLEGRRRKGALEVVARDLTPLPPELGAVFGEAAEAMRSSLDYLVNELAQANGAGQRDGSFPICTTREAYEREGPHRIRRIPSWAQEGVEQLQPYRDPDPEDHPLRHIQWVSNQDKHRDLLPAWVVPAGHAVSLHWDDSEGERAGSSPGVRGTEALPPSMTVQTTPLLDGDVVLRFEPAPSGPMVRAEVGLDVAFGDRLLRVGHLRQAGVFVLAALSYFSMGPDAPNEVLEWLGQRMPSTNEGWTGQLDLEGFDKDGRSVRRSMALGPATPIMGERSLAPDEPMS